MIIQIFLRTGSYHTYNIHTYRIKVCIVYVCIFSPYTCVEYSSEIDPFQLIICWKIHFNFMYIHAMLKNSFASHPSVYLYILQKHTINILVPMWRYVPQLYNIVYHVYIIIVMNVNRTRYHICIVFFSYILFILYNML